MRYKFKQLVLVSFYETDMLERSLALELEVGTLTLNGANPLHG